ncbi:MAG TPA: FtsK/SpoIIIE domain-containing protein [Streptosporangiaceae bacterium]|nr:FtsK/SpoIIIE domain-containing protein [Streptosporangiaceae bacterium]
MKLKVTLERPHGSTDLVLTAAADATVGDVAAALTVRDPDGRGRSGFWLPGGSGGTVPTGTVTLTVLDGQRVTLDPALPAADSGIKSGDHVTVAPAGERYADRAARLVAHVTVIQGPDAGKRVPLPGGNVTIGRGNGCDLVLSDTLVSRRHVRVFLAPGSAEILDLGSANGITLNDEPVTRGAWLPGDRLRIGETVLGIEFAGAPPAAGSAQAATTAFNRSPVLTGSYAGQTLETPELPETERPPRFQLLPLLAPFVLGGVLFAITKNAETLIFVALSPLMMVANVVEGRMNTSRGNKGSMTALRRELGELGQAADQVHAAEWRARNAEHPPTAQCLDAAARQSPLLWSRRPGTPRFLDIRVGAATQDSRLQFETQRNRRAVPAAQAELDNLLGKYRAIRDVPFTLSLTQHGAVGIAGEPVAALDVSRAVLCQLAALHSPAEVVLTAFCGSRSANDWDWLKWLPHTSSAHSPITGPHLVAGPESVLLLAQLEDLVRARLAGAAETGAAVVVLIDSRIPGDRARLVELSRMGQAAGVYCVWLAQRAEHLPAACTAYIDVRGGRNVSVGDSITSTSTAGIAADGVDEATATRFARAMAPLLDAGAVIADDSDLPHTVSWLELNDPRIAEDPGAIIERWQESTSILTGPAAPPGGSRRPGTLRAIVGVAADGPHALDLRLHGPHALVGGTTGSGKSELLQTWILAMAAAHSPQRVTFLLVDYKGGSAFRDCVHLPHTVGLVTDLSPHLVRRALRSLGAELTYREHLFAAKHVRDLEELEKAGDPETPPSLVIVVDEFAALVHEVPEFVDGVVNVAQRGRSLGLHLVLATQRPAGVIKDNLRANTNLRLALRMADESDSTDVLGSPESAHFDPALPGRAVSKTGPGRLVPFQAGYVGGRTNADRRDPDVKIEELVIGEGRTWLPPESAARPVHPEQGRSDIARITDSIRRAAELAQLPPPRRPWLDELAHVYDLARLPTRRRDDELVFGVIDEPDQQQQSVAAFYPDHEGNLAIFGTGGAGKSTTLRSLAIAAGLTARGGPCQVYCLDFSSRGLDMLADLPHVGAVIAADEGDRVRRLMRMLLAMADDRARRYAAVRAGTITEYRSGGGAPQEPRIIILLDGFTAFRHQYESADGGRWFDALANLAADGRPLGIHLILTADRPGSLPSRFSSRVQRRLVLRLADDNDYYMAGTESGALTPDSPPGRGLLGRAEFQVAVFGGATETTAQARAISQLAAAMRRQQVSDAPRVEQLRTIVRLSELPATADGRPAIGVADDILGPVGFRPEGVFLISGPPASGRTTAAATVMIALDRAAPGVVPVLFGGKRSPLASLGIWQQIATDPAEVAEAAAKIDQAAAGGGADAQRYAVVIEAVSDFLSTPADAPLVAMIKTLTRLGHVIIAEAETSALGGGWPLLNALKSGRTGLALQPEQGDGTIVYKTDFPRSRRTDYPPGRGLLVEGGHVRLLQVAIPE